ncbi:unnamed protein product [Rotaria sp. Silwood2]|nr:unnamed protein product [Rotaria sp. Silwood2]CAF3888724.1 unnamed protein product [Rotaria sp. Silwood2]
MQPKIQRLISKLSTASDLNQKETSDKRFQSISLSAQIYPTKVQNRLQWTDTPKTDQVVADEPAPDRKVRAGSGRKTPEIAGTWKQYFCRKFSGFFPVNSDQFPAFSDRH